MVCLNLILVVLMVWILKFLVFIVKINSVLIISVDVIIEGLNKICLIKLIVIILIIIVGINEMKIFIVKCFVW